ncbi:MAG: ABC transporter substrate-binding protein [Candidatus Rokubacteria bacterium]|nr:ABC transporter substrate-binding protein [Candidatus Rokubacteria bacterium]
MSGRTTLIAAAVALAILLAPPAADAQQPGKVPRIGFLCALSGPSPHTEAFQRGLRGLGYVEGKNIAIEYRFTDGKSDPFSNLAAEMVRLKVDVIVVASPQAIRPTKEATNSIPIVMAQSDDPVGSGFVTSLARPGGNITGLSTVSPELSGKRLELLKEAVPKVSRVAVLWNSTNPVAPLQFRETEVAARVLGIKLQSLAVRGPRDFDGAFAAMRRERAGALIVLPDLMFYDHLRPLLGLAAKSRLPVIYEEREFAEAGGLLAYGPNYNDLFRRSATFVDKILKGAKPADLPVEQPTKFELVINLKSARALGLTIPQSILVRADEVIR